MIHSRLSQLGLALVALSPHLLAQTPNLPPGYQATKFFQSTVAASLTGLTTDSAGQVYCVYGNGNVGRLSDNDGDGIAEIADFIWNGNKTPSVTGILWVGDQLYMSELGRVSVITDSDNDGRLDTKAIVFDGLPLGLHQNNALFRRGNRVFFGLGSIGDNGVEPDPRSATLMSFMAGTDTPTIFAEGLRNVFDGAVHPVTGDIFVGDNGPNKAPGIPNPPDEINLVRAGEHFGHPFYWGDNGSSAFVDPLVNLAPHSSPCGMTFHQNIGMSGYRNELIVTSFAGTTSTILKVPVIYGANPGDITAWSEVFADGFRTAIDVVSDDDGAMYVAEYGGSQTIWRITQESDALMIIENGASIGQTVNITLEAPGAGGFFSLPLASVGLGAPISLAPNIDLWLDVFSPIFKASYSPGKAVFDFPIPTILDAQGLATIRIHVPDDQSLIGIQLQLQHIVYDPISAMPVAISPPQGLRLID